VLLDVDREQERSAVNGKRTAASDDRSERLEIRILERGAPASSPPIVADAEHTVDKEYVGLYSSKPQSEGVDERARVLVVVVRVGR
jgi:hypothetical protein